MQGELPGSPVWRTAFGSPSRWPCLPGRGLGDITLPPGTGSWEQHIWKSQLQPTVPVSPPETHCRPGGELLNPSFGLGQLWTPHGRASGGMEMSFWRSFYFAIFQLLSSVMWQVTPACGFLTCRVCPWRSGTHAWVQLPTLILEVNQCSCLWVQKCGRGGGVFS